MAKRWMVAGVMTATVVCSLSGQAKPNFSGTWTGGSKMANLAGVIGPLGMTISQDESNITTREYGANRVSLSTKRDGTTSKNLPNPVGPRGKPTPRDLTSVATWEGDRLKIATRLTLPGTAEDKREVLTIEILSLEDGDLVVDRTDQSVGQARVGPLRGGMLRSVKDRYRRSEP